MINFDVVNDTPTTNKTIFLLTDLNVPIDANGIITDDKKIRVAMPTINYLIKTGARVVIATHLGYPAGQFDERFSTKPIAKYLNDRLPCEVKHCSDCIGENIKREIFRTEYGDIIVLENLLFHREESDCDMNFARELADGINVYVNDAFGYCEKSYASVLAVPLFVRATAGLVLTDEIKKLNLIKNSGNQFTTAIIGGAKFSEKYELLNALAETAKCIIVGGCVANTIIASSGKKIGKSLYEPALLEKAESFLKKASKNDCLVIVPSDVLVSKKFNSAEGLKEKKIVDIEDDDIIVDLGSETIKTINDVIELSKCVFWNGTLGATEFKQYKFSTLSVAEKVAFLTKKKRLYSVVCGDDTILTLKQAQLINDFSFISSNYHSTYKYLCGNVLPGIEILKRLSKQMV